MSRTRRTAMIGWLLATIIVPIVGPHLSIDIAWPLGLGSVAAATLGNAIRVWR